MNAAELFESRKENLLKVTRRDDPEYVPVMAFPSSGVLKYDGRKYVELMDDEEAYHDAMLKVWDHVYTDITEGQGIWFYPHAKEAMGTAQNFIGPDGTSLTHLQDTIMQDDEYPLLCKDPDGFVKNVLVPRRYPFLLTEDLKTAVKRIEKVVDDKKKYIWGSFNLGLDQLAKERYGIVPFVSGDYPMLEIPVDMIFDYLRGFKNTMMDLRRHKAEVKEASRVLWDTQCLHFNDLPITFPYMQQMIHMPAYMSVKQFEEFYWDYEKEAIMNIYNSGNKLYMLAEGSFKHLWDFYLDLPKDSMLINVDDDDVIEVSKIVGHHHILVGGAKLTNLTLGTAEQNIDYAKKVLDECAPSKGFIFGCDKCWVCPPDLSENLEKVFMWVHENGKY